MNAALKNKPVVDAGRFNRQLTIEHEVEVEDGCGGYVTQKQSVGSAWACISPANAKQVTRADNSVVKASHKITLRFNADVMAGACLITGARRFQVELAYDLDETRRYLECLCVEQK
jgi:SPP1 family predicted phage head-tail adaptor